MCEQHERFNKIESALKELGLRQCEECDDWKFFADFKNANIKIGDDVINKDICRDCENDLKWNIV